MRKEEKSSHHNLRSRVDVEHLTHLREQLLLLILLKPRPGTGLHLRAGAGGQDTDQYRHCISWSPCGEGENIDLLCLVFSGNWKCN